MASEVTDLQALRAPFPHLRERVYLDTAAAGLTWAGQGEAVARFYGEVKSRGYDARPEWQAMTHKVRARLASLLRVAPEAICFTSNTTEGLNLAALSLPLGPGDRVVLAADEFPSVARIWELARSRGADIVAVPIERETARAEALLAAVDRRTRVLAVSQTHSSTGTTLDLPMLARHCQGQGTLLMVDGIQSLGAVPTDLSQVDLYAASFFKWMLSGFGIGVLVTSERARAQLRPAFRGYANMDDPQQLQYAHVNTPALYGLGAALDLFERVGWTTVFERVADLGRALVAGAASRGLDLVTPPQAAAGIFVLRCADAESVREQLAARGISVSARGAGIRVAPHFYNTREEVEQCLDALADLCPPP